MKQYRQIYYSIMALSLCGISFTQAMNTGNSANLKNFASQEEVILEDALSGESDSFDALISGALVGINTNPRGSRRCSEKRANRQGS